MPNNIFASLDEIVFLVNLFDYAKILKRFSQNSVENGTWAKEELIKFWFKSVSGA